MVYLLGFVLCSLGTRTMDARRRTDSGIVACAAVCTVAVGPRARGRGV